MNKRQYKWYGVTRRRLRCTICERPKSTLNVVDILPDATANQHETIEICDKCLDNPPSNITIIFQEPEVIE